MSLCSLLFLFFLVRRAPPAPPSLPPRPICQGGSMEGGGVCGKHGEGVGGGGGGGGEVGWLNLGARIVVTT